ncbi:5-hydroxytryptamine receptor 6 isoform X2 [Polyodon spathula]|uniref:5-hydroxytryptamine receptor 6 isoform X2 n=1 Tax=Polyodon spathula TaxID=7913 RepID=UPI001B7E714F|nr:5-hydroxytryptamine receptor 6 isoform X2 [Polyodon spathula]
MFLFLSLSLSLSLPPSPPLSLSLSLSLLPNFHCHYNIITARFLIIRGSRDSIISENNNNNTDTILITAACLTGHSPQTKAEERGWRDGKKGNKPHLCKKDMDSSFFLEGFNATLEGGSYLEGGSGWVAAFLCLIILITTVGNFLLILLIFTQRCLRNTSNYFLVSLFMSDLMVGLVVMPPAMLNELCGRWVLAGGFCSVWVSFDVMCCSASILNLCVISLDRYLLIISPLKYKLRMRPGRAVMLILATWTLAALASFLPIEMGWHELDFEIQAPNGTDPSPAPHQPPSAPEDEEQCRLLVSLPYALIASSLTFFLPSIAISFTYCRILRAARKQAVQVASLTTNVASTSDAPVQVPRPAPQCAAGTSESRKLASKHSRKALKASLTLGILLGMFFVAWLPFFMANMAVCDCISGRLFDVLTWLGYCNSTMNPIIYPLFMRDFKRAMARHLPCCPRAWERRPSLVSLSVRNSHSAHRVGLSLKNMVTLPGEIESLISDPCDPTVPLPGNKDSPATGADSVNLFDVEHAGNELLPNQLHTALD